MFLFSIFWGLALLVMNKHTATPAHRITPATTPTMTPIEAVPLVEVSSELPLPTAAGVGVMVGGSTAKKTFTTDTLE